ncbi:Alpha-agarase [Pontiella sulfatireligans]|uniref:Alpha-agarase n=2 Tax=Pontiella sulfatireligans TaxID=2750658 RepID=A0A6C2UTX7_9BACT|nr:Alpha-agarase [Pontiella sulfatireligans]
MKRTIIFSLATLGLLSAFAEEPAMDKKYPYPFKYSDVTSDNISVVPIDRVIKDWGGNVLMWGEPAISEIQVGELNLNQRRIKEKIRKGREDGVRLYFGSLFFVPHSMYFKYMACDPTLQQACIRDIEGKPMYLNWMKKHTYRGVPLYWMCSNNPRSQEFYREIVTAGIEAGYDGFCIEEPRGSLMSLHVGGCFCDHCVNGFNEYLGKKYSPEELKKKGIPSLENFDYRNMVKKVAPNRDVWPAAYRKGKIPLVQDYKDYQLKAGAAVVKEMSELAKKLGGEDTAIGAFGHMLSPDWMVNAEHLDFYCMELLLGPPPEGFSRAGFTYEVARALGKPVSWGHVLPPSWNYMQANKAYNMMKSWIGFSYASGHNFGIPHYGWVHPNANAVSWDKVVKSVDGAVAPSFIYPTENCLPFYHFVTAHAELFDGYEAVEQVGVLHSNPAMRIKKNENRVRDLCWELMKANIPYGLALAGDDWLYKRLNETDLERFEFVVVPEPTMLDAEQQSVLDTWTARGKTVVWKNLDDVLARLDPVVSLESKHNMLIRPRTNSDNSNVPAVIHLLNMDYDLSKDCMNKQRDVVVRLSHKLLDGGKVSAITQYSPEYESVQVPFDVKPDGVYVTVPEVDYWSILKLDCD